jgi:hypothetical protein
MLNLKSIVPSFSVEGSVGSEGMVVSVTVLLTVGEEVVGAIA